DVELLKDKQRVDNEELRRSMPMPTFGRGVVPESAELDEDLAENRPQVGTEEGGEESAESEE
ncbi:MAG TPA: hypothetical protein VJ694_01685, partial [Patescibacteria group bacterium]|nr:hypothetical protein [Patescibacteria group bacterium]